jgi:hypothetical protein
LDPVARHLIAVFAVVGLLAVAYIWIRRVVQRRTGYGDPKLTGVGALLLVAFVVVLGIAVVMRQFFPETRFGAWLGREGVMTNFVIGCVALLLAAEGLLKWLGLRTSQPEGRDV